MVYSEHNNYGAMLVTDEGERMGLNDINAMSVQMLDDNTLENAMYYVKMFGGKFDIMTKEFNRRVKEQGKEFSSVELVESCKLLVESVRLNGKRFWRH